MNESSIPRPILSDRFLDAVSLALELHGRQARKGTETPYVSHLLAVCGLVLEDRGNEDEAIAALLHDGPEDQGGRATLERIRLAFGDRVAEIVEGLSDDLPDAGREKRPWGVRKQEYLAHLEDASASVLRVSLADKLHNISAIQADIDSGEPPWTKFNAPRVQLAWYYRSLQEVFERRLPGSRNLPAYRLSVDRVFATDQ